MEQTGCGTDGPTSGLIGYVDGEPAGWVAVEPRENYPRSVEPEEVVDADGPRARGRLVGHLLRRTQGLPQAGADVRAGRGHRRVRKAGRRPASWRAIPPSRRPGRP